MATKLSDYRTQKEAAHTVPKLSIQEHILPISTSSDHLESILLLRAKVISMLLTDPKCSSLSEIILVKISDCFSSEISQSEKALKQAIVAGL